MSAFCSTQKGQRKIAANKGYCFSIGVVGTRPPIVFPPLACVIWPSLFRSRCLTVALQCFRGLLFVIIIEEIKRTRVTSGSIVLIISLCASSRWRWIRKQLNGSSDIAASVVQSRLPNTGRTGCTLVQIFGDGGLEQYSKINWVGNNP